MHPGGVNMAFCDGSVRFIKNTISTWSYNSGWPINPPNIGGYAISQDGLFRLMPGAVLGVHQKLATRSLGEVVGADEY
jgi:prepilin-type processing-associated H-X9-DG protein